MSSLLLVVDSMGTSMCRILPDQFVGVEMHSAERVHIIGRPGKELGDELGDGMHA